MQIDQLIETNFKACTTYVEAALVACRGVIIQAIEESARLIENGGTLYFAGNGGSASDCSHVASELVGAFEQIASPLPAVAFTTDVAILTSVANDFSFNSIFLQQVRALMHKGDQLWLVSTSGESMNLFYAAAWAREQGISTVGLLGKGGGKLSTQVDFPIVVPGENTQRIQEVHILILHTLASALKHRFPYGVKGKEET